MNELFKRIHKEYCIERSKSFDIFVPEIENDIESLFQIPNSDKDNFEIATQIISDLGVYYYQRGYINKSLKYIEKGIENISLDDNIIKTGLYNDKLFVGLIWTRGQIKFSNKQYIQAASDFKKLIEKFPENDRFRNWYNSSIKYIVNKYEWTLAIIVVLGLFIRYLLDTENNSITIIATIIGAIGFLVTSIYKHKKIIKAPNNK